MRMFPSSVNTVVLFYVDAIMNERNMQIQSYWDEVGDDIGNFYATIVSINHENAFMIFLIVSFYSVVSESLVLKVNCSGIFNLSNPKILYHVDSKRNDDKL